MTFVLPTGYTLYGYSNNGDTLTAYHASSTDAEPRFLIMDRVRAVYDQAHSSWSVPRYRIRLFKGMVDADSNPKPERELMDLTIRMPIGSTNLTNFKTELNELLDHADFVTSVEGLQFPA